MLSRSQPLIAFARRISSRRSLQLVLASSRPNSSAATTSGRLSGIELTINCSISATRWDSFLASSRPAVISRVLAMKSGLVSREISLRSCWRSIAHSACRVLMTMPDGHSRSIAAVAEISSPNNCGSEALGWATADDRAPVVSYSELSGPTQIRSVGVVDGLAVAA